MNAPIAQVFIESDPNDYRFESFCREICSAEHGVEFLPTSATWDRGRDGRSGTRSSKSHRNILCATLSRDVEPKVEADLLRVTSTSSPEHLIYCCSQRLSEDKIDDIARIVKRHIPSGSLTVYGAIQLSRLAEKHPTVFERSYARESESIRTALERKPDEDQSKAGLRLALLTVGADDAAQLRESILRRTVLESLSDGAKSPTVVAQEISNDLGLPRPLAVAQIVRVLEHEKGKGNARPSGTSFELTDRGRNLLATLPAAGAEFLLEGRNLVRAKIEDLIGYKLAETQFERLWSTMLDFLSALFYQNGLTVIKAIDCVISGQAGGRVEDLRELIKGGAHRSAVAAGSTPDVQIVLETAIMDVLTEREGPAFDWLTRVCERFVALCSLGFESTTAAELKATITSNLLVLDTDIILTFLCPPGPEHDAVSDLLTRWIGIGGRILLAPVVLEEVAYHAWISQNDFRETRHLFGKLRPEEHRRLIRNAFVSSFHSRVRVLSHWDDFIAQYRGNSDGDYGKIRSLLRTRLRAEVLPDSYDEGLAQRITAYLMQTGEDESELSYDEDAQYKRTRDGRLLSSLAAARDKEDALLQNFNLLLLSSSKALRRAERKFTIELGGEPRIVLTRASFAYLLSLLPGVNLGADSLRRALFDFGVRAKLQDDERRALRIIRGAGVHDLHWAERRLLQTKLNRSIQKEALKQGTSETAIRQRFRAGTDPETSVEMISEALSSIAADKVTEEELKESKRRIRELEDELYLARAAGVPSTRRS